MDPLPIFRLLGGLSEEVTELHLKAGSPSEGALPSGMDLTDLANAGRLATELAKGQVLGRDLSDTVELAGAGPALKLAMGKEVLASFKPLVEFFSKWSTDKSTPCDVLDQVLAGIRGMIMTLRAGQTGGKSVAGATVTAPPSGAAASGVAWDLGSIALGSTGGGLAVKIQRQVRRQVPRELPWRRSRIWRIVSRALKTSCKPRRSY
jgi:hypothetical protein